MQSFESYLTFKSLDIYIILCEFESSTNQNCAYLFYNILSHKLPSQYYKRIKHKAQIRLSQKSFGYIDVVIWVRNLKV